MNNKRKSLQMIVMPLLFGLISLLNFLLSPRLANTRTVDIVRLLATGMCFGVALAGFVAYYRSRRGM